MHKHNKMLRSQKQMRAWLACIVFVLAFFACISYFSPKVSADGEDANSYYGVRTCVEASTDNGKTYGPLNNLGKDGITRKWYGEVITANKSDKNNNARVEIKDGNNDVDCIITEKAYWGGLGDGVADYYNIEIDEGKINNLDGKQLKFRFISTIEWRPSDGVTWSAVDYRPVWNGENNTNDYNKIIGFCNGYCPINSSMNITMTSNRDARQFDNVITDKKTYSMSEANKSPIKIYSGEEENLSFGITINYAVFINPDPAESIINNTVDVNRCDKNGQRCDLAGNNRASADAFIRIIYNSDFQQRTLTAYAVREEDGKLLNNGASISTKTVDYGKKAQVNNKNFDGYTFKGWRENKNSGTITSTGTTYTVNSLTSNKYVYAVYERNKFEGRAFVSSTSEYDSSTGADTGWKNEDTSASYEIKNCSSSGCKAYFFLKLRTTAGFGTTTYKVQRQTNYGSWSDVSGTTPASPFSPATDNGTRVKKAEETIKPGETICYRITFNPQSGSNATETACAFATGEYGSEINVKVKNESVSRWNNYTDDFVYAKPGDKIALQGTYKSANQAVYDYKPYATKIDGTDKSYNNNNSTTIQSAFNSLMDHSFNNAFSLYVVGSTTFTPVDFSQAVGVTSQKTGEVKGDTAYTVSKNDVGNVRKGYAKTNHTDSGKYTPKTIKFSFKDGKLTATVNTDSISDSAEIRVPYNFKNKTSVKTEGENIVYAGEAKNFYSLIDTEARYNSVTDGTYATRVNNAKWRIKLCYDDGSCFWSSEGAGNLNTNNSHAEKRHSVVIKDVNAGSRVCITSMVYPATSGGEDKYSDPEGDHQWASSSEVCYTVAKKPSLQVWGGNIYSHGMITTGTSVKNNLAGISPSYDPNIKDDNNYVFGSWGELGVVANDKVVGLASGAATGNPLGNVERTNDISFCHRSPLSFANSTCDSNYVGGVGISPAYNNVSKDKESIANRFFVSKETKYTNPTIALDETSPENYYYSAEDLTIEESLIAKGTTKVIRSDKNITINGNIYYNSTDSNILNDIPKLVIYAKNITINCTVNIIDAVLIADQDVKTCQSDDINSQDNSNPLTISGAVISNSFTPNRTYGAATGTNSVTPAEIINFDPTLYLWGGNETDNDKSILLDTTFIREVSPRY